MIEMQIIVLYKQQSKQHIITSKILVISNQRNYVFPDSESLFISNFYEMNQ